MSTIVAHLEKSVAAGRMSQTDAEIMALVQPLLHELRMLYRRERESQYGMTAKEIGPRSHWSCALAAQEVCTAFNHIMEMIPAESLCAERKCVITINRIIGELTLYGLGPCVTTLTKFRGSRRSAPTSSKETQPPDDAGDSSDTDSSSDTDGPRDSEDGYS